MGTYCMGTPLPTVNRHTPVKTLTSASFGMQSVKELSHVTSAFVFSFHL